MASHAERGTTSWGSSVVLTGQNVTATRGRVILTAGVGSARGPTLTFHTAQSSGKARDDGFLGPLARIGLLYLAACMKHWL